MQAVKWYRLAANLRDPDGQYALASMYSEGQGVPKDDVLAVKWYTLAAERGHASAQWALGISYMIGEGVAKNYVQAYMWFNLSLAQNEVIPGFRG